MRKHSRLYILLALLLSSLTLLTFPLAVLAAPSTGSSGGGGIVQVGQNWSLPSNKQFMGDVLVISANVSIAKGAVLVGDIAVISGDVIVHGEVNGDIDVISGNVILSDKSRVNGDISVVAGNLQKAPTAVVTGNTSRNKINIHLNGSWGNIGRAWGWSAPQPGTPQWLFLSLWRLIAGIIGTFFSALVAALVAALIVAIWPIPVKRVAETTVRALPVSLFVGLAVLLAVLVISILLVLTICFSPIAVLLWLVELAMLLFGWTAIGYIIGDRIWRVLNLQGTSEVLSTATGVFVLSLLSNIPCIGWLLAIMVASIGFGATLLSQFGAHIPEGTWA